MNRTQTSAAILLGLGTLLQTTAADAAVLRAERPIAGQYIVVLRPEAERPAVDLDLLAPTPRRIQDLAVELSGRFGGVARRSFGHALEGFTFDGTPEAAAALARDPRVAYVAEDGLVSAAGAQTPTPSWGLDRIDQAAAALDNTFNYNVDGTGIDIYFVDSGVRSTHQDFGNRVDTVNAYSTVPDDLGTEDCNGHGTLVAGLAAGSTYGVAKGATIHPVRVLDCYGSGALSHLVAGVDWITARYPLPTKKFKPGPSRAVVNMSINAGFAQVLDDAIANSISHGITYVVAAGNDAGDACYVSPARANGAITVGATESGDLRWASSNFGPCVDLFAPGRAVVSSFIRSDVDAIPFTGTSAAAPHVAGTVALMLQVNPAARPQDVLATLRAAATADAVVDAGEGSPNLLLYSGFAGSGEDFPPYASFTVSCSGSTCTFNAGDSADDWGILSYAWNFGNGKTGSGVKVQHRYRGSSAGIVATLTVTDTSGQTATYQISLDGAW